MRERVLTSLVLAPLVYATLVASAPYPLIALMAVAATLAHREVSEMVTGRPHRGPVLSLVLLAVIAVTCAVDRPRFLATMTPLVWSVIWGLCILLTPVLASRKFSRPWDVLAGEVATLVWVALPMVCVLWLHQLNPATGMWNLLSAAQLVVLPIWAGDIAGIVVGRRFGKRLLWPSISPSKTWVGAAANFAAASLITVGLGQALALPADTVALACFATGILGQLGDLFESNLKRMAGLKDSGNLLPGHGGLMDRIDSILFTAPAMALLLHFTQN